MLLAAMQSRALLYLFTLTHSLMEAMAAAEQAIELASDATHTHSEGSPITSQDALLVSSNPSKNVTSVPEQADIASTSSSSGSSSPTPRLHQAASRSEETFGTHKLHDDAMQTGFIEPVASCRQRARPQQQQAHPQVFKATDSDHASEEAQPLIARPEGYLRVSVDQRPAKKHFDRCYNLVLLHA